MTTPKGAQTHQQKLTNARRFKESIERREKFLEVFRDVLSVKDTLAEVGVSKSTYEKWRSRYPEFAARVDVLKQGIVRTDTVPDWQEGFAEFRLRYFGMHSPWFHLLAIDAYESTPPGNITIVLWPPEHGKTTLYEDYASSHLALHPLARHAVGSEKQQTARKILSRVKSRMSPFGPFPRFVADYGPFEPQTGEDGVDQTWAADMFNVWKRGAGDERDYSMVALGIGSAIAGTRSDHLHIDDVMSLRNYKQAESITEIIRQDWLTRPGEHGRTTFAGTRVGEDDVYELLERDIEPSILRVIRFPAVVRGDDGQLHPLWEFDPEHPEHGGYTMNQLDRMRTKVGEEAWARNYMQKPRSGKSTTFSKDVIRRCHNPTRRTCDRPPVPDGVGVVTIDPGFGRNVVHSQVHAPDRLWVMDFKVDDGLGNNEAIMARAEDAILDMLTHGITVTDLVIETMAFQAGLQNDDKTLEIAERYGVNIRGHQTGVNKYDETIGVASLARSFRLREIDLPYGDDEPTRYEMDELERELLAWKPYVKGNKLVQDRVMALWFGWILWRDRKWSLGADPDQFVSAGMPFAPTGSGLFVPTGLGGR